MKKPINALLVLLVAFTLFISCKDGGNPKDSYTYGEATKELIGMVDKDTLLKSLLVSSIQKARDINPDSVTNPSQSLEQYYAFVSKAESSMPWGYYMTDHKLPSTFEHIFQSLGAFYFVIDQPLPQLEGKGLFHNSLQYYEPFAQWLTTFNKSWQKYLDSEKSWSEEYYKVVANDSAFGAGNHLSNILAQIEKQWKVVYPDRSFNYGFLDEDIAWLLEKDRRSASLMDAVMAITIFISCMGIFGLATFAAQRRTKEIGIRKVLGATATGITMLLGKELVTLVMIATILSCPIAWYFMDQWLQGFAYRSDLSWWLFVVAGFAGLAIALITISFQTIRAASKNPVESLKVE